MSMFLGHGKLDTNWQEFWKKDKVLTRSKCTSRCNEDPTFLHEHWQPKANPESSLRDEKISWKSWVLFYVKFSPKSRWGWYSKWGYYSFTEKNNNFWNTNLFSVKLKYTFNLFIFHLEIMQNRVYIHFKNFSIALFC